MSRLGRDSTGLGRSLKAAGQSFLSAAVARRVLAERQPGGAQLWLRSNHRGEPISLLAGPALTVGLLAGHCQAYPTMGSLDSQPLRRAIGHLVAISGAGAFGLIDDLGEDSEAGARRAKGLKGHLGALREGRVTTGALKVLGIGMSAGTAALLLTNSRGSRTGFLLDASLNGVLIAGSANLMNLLDLRPGRALKVGALGAVSLIPTRAHASAGAVLGAAGAAIRADLAEQDMLGDCGANALGASLGAGAVATPRPVRLVLAGGIIALTMASERVSFSAVIERHPVLRALDGIGRLP